MGVVSINPLLGRLRYMVSERSDASHARTRLVIEHPKWELCIHVPPLNRSTVLDAAIGSVLSVLRPGDSDSNTYSNHLSSRDLHRDVQRCSIARNGYIKSFCWCTLTSNRNSLIGDTNGA